MIPNTDELNAHVRMIERHSAQSTTSERAMQGIEEAAIAIEHLADGDRAAELARAVRDAVSRQRDIAAKRRIYTTAIGERIDELVEYLAMRAEQPDERPGLQPPS